MCRSSQGRKLTDEARRDLVAQHEAESREVEEMRAAVAASEVPCPGEPDLQLVRRAEAHWENARLRFNADSRHLTDAQRREGWLGECDGGGSG